MSDEAKHIVLSQMDDEDIVRYPAPGYRCDEQNCENNHEHQRIECGGCGQSLGHVEVSDE